MDTILLPLLYPVSWILMGWHWLFENLVGDVHDGAAWLLAIIGLVIVIRILLIPLFVKQIKAQRNMQVLQPKVRELQKKFKGDRQRLQEETMKLYKDAGTNPFASCLPILLQAPFLFALFRVLHGVSTETPRGQFTTQPELFESFRNAEIFGAPLSATFLDSGDNTTVRIIAAILVLGMVATTFITQRQIMRKNMPPEALEGPFAQQQKILLYVLPLVFLFSGVFFPLGVVIYWLTSNLWTMGQQLYVIRRMPAPGSPAEEARKRRSESKAHKHGEAVPETVPSDGGPADTSTPARPARQQPKRQSRAQRKGKK